MDVTLAALGNGLFIALQPWNLLFALSAVVYLVRSRTGRQPAL